jgi:hypothetical protein
MAKMTLDDLTTQLRSAFGPDLRAVVLYGSAAAGEHIPKRSDYNVLVIVDRFEADRLKPAGAVFRAWSGEGNPAPLILTTDEWRSSADIFPMEYADILERHRVLHGAPPFDGIEVSSADLRLQLEQQAMGKLLHLRRGALAAGGEGKAQLALLEASLSPIMIVFRAVSRLHQERPATDNEALSRETARRAGFDAEPFVRVVRHVRGEVTLRPAEAGGVLDGYLQGMERLVGYLNRFGAGSA